MKELLKNNAKNIIHIRQQVRNNRLGLIFGAGISVDLKFPSWNDLIKNIVNHKEINSSQLYNSICSSNQSSIIDIIFHKFYNQKEIELKETYPDNYHLNKKILSEWRGIIHECLYTDDVKFKRNELIKSHPYLNEFLPLIEKSEMTINYNFDDTLECMFELKYSENETKSYQTIWETHSQYKNNTPVIYHPNGFLPLQSNSRQSEKLVFSEESFSNQLIDSFTNKYATIINQLNKKTCILVGLSLNDITLKNLLRQSALSSPGNHHYFVKFSKETLSNEEKEAIFNSNFAVYMLQPIHSDT